MSIHTTWNEKMNFTARLGDHSIALDAHAPIGTGQGFTPKELVAAGISGCTGMDVAALLRKFKEPLQKMDIEVSFEQTKEGYPIVFASVQLDYHFEGEMNPEKVLEAVRLSMTRYCGVTAMIAKTAPIQYNVHLNGTLIGEGKAEFNMAN